jgi:hypothetical protein
VDGKRLRKSLETRDWARATRKLALIEDPSLVLVPCLQPECTVQVDGGRCETHTREISSAIKAYHDTYTDASEGTRRNRKRALRFLEEFLIGRACGRYMKSTWKRSTPFGGRAR